MAKKHHQSCPNCHTIWGYDEIENQECYSCSYPDLDDEDEPDDEYQYDDEQDY